MLSMLFQTIVSMCLVGLYTVFFVYLPSNQLLKRCPLSRLEKFVVTLVLGWSLYSCLVYVVRFFNLPFWVAELGMLVLGIGLQGKKPSLKWSLPKLTLTVSQKWFALITILLALVQSAVLIRSAIPTAAGLTFVELSFHDSMQHLSFIVRLYTNGQVLHPGYAGAELKNYHYLIDSTLAAITRFPLISLFDVYYRIYPLFVSMLFSSSLFILVRRLTRSELAANWAIIFTMLAGNASYFAQFIRGEEFTWSANAFLINPIVDILQNPASIFVLSQMLVVAFLIMVAETKKAKIPGRYWLIIGLISGSMIGFKAWGGLLIHGALIVTAVWYYIRHKSLGLGLTFLISLSLAAILFVPGYDPETSASPIWAPGWSLRRLMNDADRWNNIPELYQEETFIFQHNIPRLIKLYTKWILIYWLGNYWIRIIGFGVILFWLRKLFALKAYQVLIIALTVASFSLPILFNQGRMAYDIEQFSPYAIIWASIMTITVLFQLGHRYFSHKHTVAGLNLLFLLVVLLSAPSNTTSIKARSTGAIRHVSTAELELFSYIKSHTKPWDVFVLYPSHRNIATLEFAALTGRDTFYSGRTLSVITGEDYETRKDTLIKFFNSMNTAEQQKLIETYEVNYIFMYTHDLEQVKDTQLPGEVVFQNSAGMLIKTR